MVATGVVPCAVSAAAAPLTKHDCCDPDQPGAVGAADRARSMLTTAPLACCLASADDRVPPAPPAASGNNDARVGVAVAADALAFGAPEPSVRIDIRDFRSRPAPRAPLVTVLLI